MGNIIVQQEINDEGNANAGNLKNITSILSKIINTGLSSNESKKRACCLHLNKIPTVLPFVNNNKEISYGVIFINPLSSDYNFFDPTNSHNKINNIDQCSIAEHVNEAIPTETSLISFNNYVPNDWLYYDIGDPCREFYQNTFCIQANTNENCVLANSPFIGTIDSSSGAFLYNNYIDCNCVNSQMINNNMIVPSKNFATGTSPPFVVNDTAFAYVMDKQCNQNLDITIKLIPEVDSIICLNAVSLKYVQQTSGCMEIIQHDTCGDVGGPPSIDICGANGCPIITTSSVICPVPLQTTSQTSI